MEEKKAEVVFISKNAIKQSNSALVIMNRKLFVLTRTNTQTTSNPSIELFVMYITQDFVHLKIYVDKIIVFFFLAYLFFHIYFSHWILFFPFVRPLSSFYPMSLFRLVFLSSIFSICNPLYLFYLFLSCFFLIYYLHCIPIFPSVIFYPPFILCSISSSSPPYPNIFHFYPRIHLLSTHNSNSSSQFSSH